MKKELKEKIIYLRNSIIHVVYGKILKPIFFRMDPEVVHDRMTNTGKLLGKFWLTRFITKIFFDYQNKSLEQEILKIKFKNPVGLSAGFDKDAELTDILPSVGFGFEEIGSITGHASDGNPKPRLWRLKKSKSLVVYYGLKNKGAEKISDKLEDKKFNFALGTSVAMTNCQDNTDEETAIKDYVKAFSSFVFIGDYITVNISCPNAIGGQPFTNPSALDKLLSAIDKVDCAKPIFLKLSPDLTHTEIDELLKIIKSHRVHGLIISNLTKPRDNVNIKDDVPEKGGISGKVVEGLSNDLLKYVYSKVGRDLVLVGVGGIFTAEDAYRKIRLGASLVQLITGMIFEGPQTISEINRGLVELLKKDGFKNVSEAIGVDNKS
jgi:dihydroorotate dehydrogenase